MAHIDECLERYSSEGSGPILHYSTDTKACQIILGKNNTKLMKAKIGTDSLKMDTRFQKEKIVLNYDYST